MLFSCAWLRSWLVSGSVIYASFFRQYYFACHISEMLQRFYLFGDACNDVWPRPHPQYTMYVFGPSFQYYIKSIITIMIMITYSQYDIVLSINLLHMLNMGSNGWMMCILVLARCIAYIFICSRSIGCFIAAMETVLWNVQYTCIVPPTLKNINLHTNDQDSWIPAAINFITANDFFVRINTQLIKYWLL